MSMLDRHARGRRYALGHLVAALALLTAGCAADNPAPLAGGEAGVPGETGGAAASQATSPAAQRGLPHTVLATVADGRLVPLAIVGLVPGGTLSSGFGWRGGTQGGSGTHHDGIDIRAPEGTPVTAAATGVIVEARARGHYGNLVRIAHGGGVETVYAHLLRFAPGIATGRTVRQGEAIGAVGRTGNATGAHLHFELRLGRQPVDPLALPAAAGP